MACEQTASELLEALKALYAATATDAKDNPIRQARAEARLLAAAAIAKAKSQ